MLGNFRNTPRYDQAAHTATTLTHEQITHLKAARDGHLHHIPGATIHTLISKGVLTHDLYGCITISPTGTRILDHLEENE